MAIAGAVVVPLKPELVQELRRKLEQIEEIQVEAVTPTGIAVVLEARDMHRLKKLSEEINEWDEVIEVDLAYLNWEDLGEGNSRPENQE